MRALVRSVNDMTRLVVIIGFVIAFAAGVMVGLGVEQRSVASPGNGATTMPSHRGPLAELNLTPQQEQSLKEIWSDTAHRGHGEQDDRRRQLRQQRDEALAALIRPEDKAKYDAAIKSYNDQMSAMNAEMHKSFEDSVARTKALLTAEQRVRYEEILKRRQHEWGHDRETTRRSSGGATSRPS